MAEGIRIRHHTRRSELLPVPLLHKPFPAWPPPLVCGACVRELGKELRHPCKTLHLRLDDEGSVIVSREVWADMRQVVNTAGFRAVNAVAKPPTQGIAPALVQHKIDGIALGGLAAHQHGRAQISTPAGITNPEAQPDVRQVSLEEYLDIAEQRYGLDEGAAKRLLLIKLLFGGRENGRKNRGADRADQRPVG